MGELPPVRTAVEQAGGTARGAEAPAQAGLFEDGADLEAMPGPLAGMKRGPGRPKGARNRSTADLVEHVKRTGRDPLLVMRDWANAEVGALAAHLSCTRLEAAKLQIGAAKELAPYLHSKQPVAIQGGDDGFMLVVGTVQAAGPQGSATVIDLPWETEENQGVEVGGSDGVGQGELDSRPETEAGPGLEASDPLSVDQPGDDGEASR